MQLNLDNHWDSGVLWDEDEAVVLKDDLRGSIAIGTPLDAENPDQYADEFDEDDLKLLADQPEVERQMTTPPPPTTAHTTTQSAPPRPTPGPLSSHDVKRNAPSVPPKPPGHK